MKYLFRLTFGFPDFSFSPNFLKWPAHDVGAGVGVTYKRLPTAMADAVISAYMALIEKSAKEAPSVVRITDPNTGVITVADFVKMMYGLQTMKVILN